MTPAATTPDLSLCEKEPIHISGSIQPHGVLLTLDQDQLRIIQASANTSEFLGLDAASISGKELQEIFGKDQGDALARQLRALGEGEPVYLRNVIVESLNLSAIAHRSQGTLILEMERTESAEDLSFQNLHPLVQAFLSRSRTALSFAELTQLSVDQIRSLTGFDRVLLYKFNPEWNGHVLAEARAEDYASYLDLWFPASDIPAQARKLYTLNRFRSIADTNYQAVPLVPVLNPITHAPVDLSFSSLRSVSPVHVEYLKNMEVGASMSISILTEDAQLWGLIACHHRTARHVPVEVRTACDFLAQTLSVQLQASEERGGYRQRIELSSRTAKLLGYMAREDVFIDGLLHNPQDVLNYVGATGAAVIFGGTCTAMGESPSPNEVMDLVAWLIAQGRAEVFSTNNLSSEFPKAEAYTGRASGVMAIPISQIHQSYILWFRPEIVRTVKWSGDPQKPVSQTTDGQMRIHPRKSFEIWSETVRGSSLPWSEAEQDAVSEFRNAVVGVVLRKAEELADLSAELQRSNSELAAFSYSVSHDLRAPFRHIVGYSELLRKSKTAQLGDKDIRYVDTIIESAQFAGTLVDNLLSFAQVGRAKLQIRRVDTDKLVTDVRRDLQLDCAGRNIEWHVAKLPAVKADMGMLYMVWQNLLHNAIKYTRTRPLASVEVSVETTADEHIFGVHDNGVGFDQAYADKLFGVFQRLHRMEDFEGTGIGLANVRRAIARHGGRTWAEGRPDAGATFYFTLPCESKAEFQDATT